MRKLQGLWHLVWDNKKHRLVVMLVVGIAFGVVGTLLLTFSHASTPTATVESEAGQVAGNSATTSDNTASGSQAVKFGSQNPFVTASGTNFVLSGSTFKWIGFDAYGMEGCYTGTVWTTAQMDSYFSQLPTNGVTRIWAFRTVYGTTLTNTALIQTILTEAAKYNQHVILVLGDGNATCGETDYSFGDHNGKTLQFYQSGWKDLWLSWVNTVVPMFKNNPQIMMWEVANEPKQKNQPTPPTLAEWQAYFKGTSDAIRALDPNHLIGMGSNTPSNLGGLTNYNTLMNTPNIDAVSFHDYSYEFETGAVVSGTFNAAKQAATQYNKPFYVGEAGVPSGSTCSDVQYTQLSFTSQVAFLKSKADNYFTNGIGGVNYWEYEPLRAHWVAACAYEMYPTDPMINIVKNYVAP